MLIYDFSSKRDGIEREAHRLAKDLPDGIAVAFSSLMMEDGQHASRGYIVSREKVESAHKRFITDYERGMLNGQAEAVEKEWNARGDALVKNKASYAELSMGGVKLECRVCADIDSRPKKTDLEAITVVPAHWLDDIHIYGGVHKKSKEIYGVNPLPLRRKAIVVNDSVRPNILLLSREPEDRKNWNVSNFPGTLRYAALLE